MRVFAFVCVVLAISGPGFRAFGQLRDCRILISGHVTEQDTSIKIRHALVHLKADNGDMFECATDSTGHYEFCYRRIRFHHAEISVMTDRGTRPVNKPGSNGYIASNDKGLIDTGDSIRHYIKDFRLMPSCGGCFSLPAVLFKRNSSRYDTLVQHNDNGAIDSLHGFPMQAIRFIYEVLSDNPTMKIEISAHCSTDEREPKYLSYQRAQRLKAELIRLGIEEKRLVAVGYGASKPLIKDNVIQKAQTKEEMMILRTKNRRCVFKILSWDYKDQDF